MFVLEKWGKFPLHRKNPISLDNIEYNVTINQEYSIITK
jgi:hypothetical protein